MGDGSRLYMCGTNAHSPKDWVIYVSIEPVMPSLFMSHIISEHHKKELLLGAESFKLGLKLFYD